MTEIALTVTSIVFACIALFIAVAFLRVFKSGRRKISYLRRKHYGLSAWAAGALPKTTTGTTVHELEGLELKAKNGRLIHVRQTRAATSEV
jgi:hypothetical protein